jgi:rhodanese-related sulfurtransferase
MDVVGLGGGADIVELKSGEPRSVSLNGAPMDVAGMGLRGARSKAATPALPASIAALLLAHRIELEIDVCDLFDAQLRGNAPPLIDARVSRAFRAGHIPDAIHMPSASVPRTALLSLPAAPFVVVYGADAHRLDAVRTAQALAEQGIAVKLLSGGFAAWEEQGFPVEQPVAAQHRIAAL